MNETYHRDVRIFLKGADKKLGQFTRKVAINTLNSVTLKTPVDTGRARASWNIADSFTPDLSVAPEKDAGQIASSALETKQKASLLKDGNKFIISNNLPYIEKLEGGSSQQAPAGMVRVTLAEIAAKVKAGLI